VLLSLALQLGEALLRQIFRAELLELNAVVIPIQLLAQITDLADQFALACFAHREALAALKNHFNHAARLRGFYAGKGLVDGDFAIFGIEVEVHKGFVDVHAIFDEGDFQFLTAEPGAQGFESFTGFLISGVSSGAIAPVSRDLPE